MFRIFCKVFKVNLLKFFSFGPDAFSRTEFEQIFLPELAVLIKDYLRQKETLLSFFFEFLILDPSCSEYSNSCAIGLLRLQLNNTCSKLYTMLDNGSIKAFKVMENGIHEMKPFEMIAHHFWENLQVE